MKEDRIRRAPEARPFPGEYGRQPGITKFDDAAVPDIPETLRALVSGEEVAPCYSLEDMAEDAAGLLDALDIQRAPSRVIPGTGGRKKERQGNQRPGWRPTHGQGGDLQPQGP
ncbi:MAG: hypothetical protein GY859_41675 [Desulfobacterales bacterium]|nr:hypothetical protein [Desulfobacterales bacterium]